MTANRAARGRARALAGVLGAGMLGLAACTGPAPAGSTAGGGAPPRAANALPGPLSGVTIDDVSRLDDIVTSLARLPRRPIARVVLDAGAAPASYTRAVGSIGRVAYVMAEPVDSSDMPGYSRAAYRERFASSLAALGGHVDVWEIGNEVNGEWLGRSDDVAGKIASAYDLVHAAGGRTALTLLYNPDCADDPSHSMWTWAGDHVPERMRRGLDYVFLSYYEADCGGRRYTAAQWTAVFGRLRAMFPHASLGFGEVGADEHASVADKRAYLERYYRLDIPVAGYVGGYFWWYYAEDMLPSAGNPLWEALAGNLRTRA